MRLSIRTLTGGAIPQVIDELARLRIRVFRDYPYLYEGDLAYEARYLAEYARSPRSAVIAVFDEERSQPDRLVGAATALPLQDEPPSFYAPVAEAGIDVARVCYFGESILDEPYRGRGIGHRFFDEREAHARSLGLSVAMFCAVIRPDNHPLRPADYRPLDPFWRKRGYLPVPGLIARLNWKDLGEQAQSEKRLQFWMRDLAAPA